MSQPSTLVLERTSPRTARIRFSNPPVNLVIPETVVSLHRIIGELDADPDIQVVTFESDLDDFFFNHFDGAASADLPQPANEGDLPVWSEAVIRLSKASFVSIAVIRGRARGAGNELALAADLRYASREKAFFGQPEVGIGIVPGGGGSERLTRSIGRDRALEVILGSADYDAATAERWGWITRALPDAELDAFVDATVARLASFDPAALALAKNQVNRASLPPDGDIVAAYEEFAGTLTNPGFYARAMVLAALGEQHGIAIEYDLGRYIADANASA
jgi:enoyl-CoA hydratase/carnithine racemase